MAVKDMGVHYRDDAGRPVLIDVEAVAVHPGFRADAVMKRLVFADPALAQTPLDARFFRRGARHCDLVGGERRAALRDRHPGPVRRPTSRLDRRRP